jgi:hypothetical protein
LLREFPVKHKNLSLFGCCLLLFFFLNGCVPQQQMYAAPTLLPGTDRTMLTPGFWISRHPSPDTLVLTTEQIADLNHHIENELRSVTDISRIPIPYSGGILTAVLNQDIELMRSKNRYLSSGQTVPCSFYDRISEDMDIAAIPSSIVPEYGVVVRFADQRVLPTRDPLYGSASEVDFDGLQNNALELGTPLLILHWSRDLQWAYVRSSMSAGWVESQHIARCSTEAVEDFVQPGRVAVVLRPKADIYRNPGLNYSEEYVQMGVHLPLIEVQENAYHVMIPIRDSQGYLAKQDGYILKNHASDGYLPYTARNILQQAFEMLNAPYGWGGMYGEQDCSRYIQQIFATVGIHLPRNSADQAMVGKRVAKFESDTPESDKLSVLGEVSGGITTLYMKGHIMLYLGKVGFLPYAIHQTWAFRMRNGDQDAAYKVNRVAVTDMDLGRGTRNGSLLDRLQSIQVIQ